jgi:formate/nitrite transporter FocA (FNT family)
MNEPDDLHKVRPTEDSQPLTERSLERHVEDRTWVPVIVKRTDEARRHPDDVLKATIEEGLEQLARPTFSLGLSAVAAGLILGFTAMAVAVVSVAAQPLADWPMLERVAVALVYPLGFVVCLMSGAELYTEHTATAVYPVLDRKAGFGSLLRLWITIVVGNLVGAFVSASLMIGADSVIGAREGYIEIGRHLVAFPSMALLLSAILAGWLMALGAWLIMATPPTVSQIVSIYIVTFLIGLGGLHHSIAGAVEIFAAVLASNEFGVSQVVRFLSLALIGNLIGGSFFVAALNYAHIRKSRETPTG